MGERRITRDSPQAAGGDPLVIGCTKVPLVLDAADAPAPCVDAAAVLVERTVAFPLGGWEP